ncbi:hypothetical protein GIS00_11045 [Nakamurella sp. YIM 132087]|uniref:Uncharacterized protein n=1 Tax=Nakamurella alba TaxID=2665158 RepID=A0A7K1FK22_9ACTN|nr:hypothetical protein [Nakamurella alba]MTD14482.1 hypothetical protein [Nakamurella alba]
MNRWQALAGLQALTGVSAVAGGVLLAVRPDGSLLRIDPELLRGSRFRDWRWPGLLLAGVAGGGHLGVAVLQCRHGRRVRMLSAATGLALIGFEVAEARWLGRHPLQLIFGGIGAVCVASALTGAYTSSEQWVSGRR